MTWQRIKKEYFTACFAAVLTATVGMFVPEEGEEAPSSFALLGIIALLMVVGMYIKFGKSEDGLELSGEDTAHRIGRMKRMTYLWYVLSLVLAGALVRGPLGHIMADSARNVGRIELMSAAVGIVVIGFSIWKILVLGRKNGNGK